MADYKTKLYKAFICPVLEDQFYEKIVKAGGQGLESSSRYFKDLSIAQATKIRNRVESFGLRFHSVMHGAQFNSRDNDVREQSLKKMFEMIKIATRLGCDSMLNVPLRIDNAPLPKPYEFKIKFDPKNCQIQSIVDGDNTPYKKYIEEHNFAVNMLLKYYERLMPVLAYEGLTLAPENVWNNFMVLPEIMAAIVKMFDSRWIRFNYDIGNNVKYRPNAAEAIRQLGAKYIAKLHIKDFKIIREHKNGGIFVPIGFGDINWKEIRTAIEEVGFSGWVTLEDIPHFTPEEHVKILDLFFEGKLDQQSAEKIHPYKIPVKK